ncbi:MAG: ferric reductase-like transmembrane domain-containing protein [Oscillospiraceae bacterium]|nr:ferric reductase-like transmembrane domain-containing protein [Oscillospiraceae bacterium]
MLFLTAIVIACIFSWFCGEALRKHPYLFYGAGALLTIVMFVLGNVHLQAIPDWVNTYVIGLFTHGALAGALWCVVAYTGALPNGSAPMKRLMPCRGELSIFTAIITLSHAVLYGVTYVKRLFSGRPAEADFLMTCVISLLLMLIMVPLTVISFKQIRKKFKAKTWKNIQRAAYVFYALIYMHVLVIMLPRAKMGREGAMLSVIVYSVIFLGYAAMRLHKMLVRKKPERRRLYAAVCGMGALVIIGGTAYAAYPLPEVPARVAAETEPETEAAETIPAETEPDTTEPVPTTEAPTEGTTEPPTEETTEETTVETTEETTEEAESTPEDAPQEEQPQQDPQEEQPQQEQPAPEPEPQYQYNNGTYSVTLFGYDAEEHFEITIENDRITSINGWCDESDPWYFDEAMRVVRDAILNANSPDVPDMVSGATISSDAIKQAVRQALDQARKS